MQIELLVAFVAGLGLLASFAAALAATPAKVQAVSRRK